ncbi:response regulator [Cryobacterium mannosilyticum]|uniref:Response regulator transcription factor n=1 Tax=Cryobacterium mannosilyticum TaxID=1259190 RepID=A0A4R8W6W6_9MICO|nr:response regulator transcription factor [Cryobacterium mannosilyticum]TFC03065.1 response regulator transcription factor [Cryobacterium mannosilyticum]
MIRILIVDDHNTFAELLAEALDREADLCTVGSANNGRRAIELCDTLRPDLVVLDYHLPDESGLSVAALILAQAPATRIVMLTGDPTPEILERAASIGVCAFLPKDGSLIGMLDTLRHARVGGFMVHPSLVAQLSAQWRLHEYNPAVQALTRRELEVLHLMARGNDVRANALTLGISENTCRGYVKSILAKLEVHSQLEAVVSATRLGLVGVNERV